MRIGVDLGGTKIEAVALAADGGEIARQRVATPASDYAAVLQAVAGLVVDVERAAGSSGSVGVGTPGFLSPGTGLIRNSNLACLNDRPLDVDLSAALGRPVRIANDGNCFTLSEATDGAAASPATLSPGLVDVVFGATLGTGIGGGIVIDGRVLGGANGSASEWSHTTLPFLGEGESSPYRCFCGHAGCVESFLSGRGMAADHHRATGQELGAPEIARLANAGDAAAAATLERYESRLARALASVINLLDPRAIVLGGGISNNQRIFTNVPRLWEQYTVARDLETKLVAAKHGDASGVRGAACLWPL
jgi:predicted NBD/HSP70 family sugar kinase